MTVIQWHGGRFIQVRCQRSLPRPLSRPGNAGPGRALTELGRSADLTGTLSGDAGALRELSPVPSLAPLPPGGGLREKSSGPAAQSSSTQATNGASGSKVAANTKGHRRSSLRHVRGPLRALSLFSEEAQATHCQSEGAGCGETRTGFSHGCGFE